MRTEQSISASMLSLPAADMSYPATGSTGDGYRLAQQAGHTITELRPSLVSLVANGKDCPALQGLSLKMWRFT
ncbi:MAG: hypothetical protein ACLTE2_03835 [Eubacteriales bacterium]